jgi:hypothetical protein
LQTGNAGLPLLQRPKGIKVPVAGDNIKFMLAQKLRWIALKQLDFIQLAGAGLVDQADSLRNFEFGLRLNGVLRGFYSTDTHALAAEDRAKA